MLQQCGNFEFIGYRVSPYSEILGFEEYFFEGSDKDKLKKEIKDFFSLVMSKKVVAEDEEIHLEPVYLTDSKFFDTAEPSIRELKNFSKEKYKERYLFVPGNEYEKLKISAEDAKINLTEFLKGSKELTLIKSFSTVHYEEEYKLYKDDKDNYYLLEYGTELRKLTRKKGKKLEELL